MPLPILDLPWWGYLLALLAMTHVTIASVTIFLHRHQAHRALELHPLASHFFRFWLWFTTGMVTREWVAVHRKHHARCDADGDPHSPVRSGLWQVLWHGTELYREAAAQPDTLARYGKGTPDDWLERSLYARHSALGVSLLLIVDVLLFGAIGLTIWALQMIWIPFFAAGVINGVGHFWGYRSFATRDASRNILPWGILIGGEELHNNHHAHAASARLSNHWWEVDLGWLYIRGLALLRLASRIRVAPPSLRRDRLRAQFDTDALRSICTNRLALLAEFARALKGTAGSELRRLRKQGLPRSELSTLRRALRRLLQREDDTLAEPERAVLNRAASDSVVLQTILQMRTELTALWSRAAESGDDLAHRLEAWCQRAEASGIAALREFAFGLRRVA